MLYTSALHLEQGKLSPGCTKTAWEFFSLRARQSCDIKPTACYRLGCWVFFPHLPHFALARQRSFQLGRACGMPDTPPNFHRESRNLYTNTRKLGSPLLLGGRSIKNPWFPQRKCSFLTKTTTCWLLINLLLHFYSFGSNLWAV